MNKKLKFFIPVFLCFILFICIIIIQVENKKYHIWESMNSYSEQEEIKLESCVGDHIFILVEKEEDYENINDWNDAGYFIYTNDSKHLKNLPWRKDKKLTESAGVKG